MHDRVAYGSNWSNQYNGTSREVANSANDDKNGGIVQKIIYIYYNKFN